MLRRNRDIHGASPLQFNSINPSDDPRNKK